MDVIGHKISFMYKVVTPEKVGKTLTALHYNWKHYNDMD